RNFIKAFFASAISSVVTIAVYRVIANSGHMTIGTLVSVLVTAIVYFVLLLVFNVVQKSDIILLPKGQKIYRVLKKIRLMK
ncbi:MAG: polysaccharide biosynthesis protein, partial [Clostridia bacterium]|nr:polysaccharide biosynthesis protein [Clostridia bacterium]